MASVPMPQLVMKPKYDMTTMTAAIYYHPTAAAELIQAIPAERQPFVFRALVWLLKLGVLKVCP